jgi:hypothetical protein
MTLAAWALFVWAPIAHHRAFNSNAYDFGFFDQIVWNTAHGRWFQTSFVPYNFAGQHMEPVLLLFAAWYRVQPNPEVMLAVQGTAAAWAAVPLFLAAARVLRSATAGLLVSAAYLVAAPLHNALLFDFHPEVLSPLAIFGAFALLVYGRPGWALAAIGSLLLLKEDMAIALAGFALIVWLCGYRRQALMLAAGAAAYLLIVAGVLMPALRGGPGDLQARYAYFGNSPAGVAHTLLLRPDVVVRHLAAPPQLRATAALLGGMAFLPLAGPACLAAAPLLAANLLSTHPQQHDLMLHYPIVPYALLLVAAVMGIERLTPWLCRRLRLAPSRAGALLAALLLGAEAMSWLLGSPLGPHRFTGDDFRQTAHTAVVRAVLSEVPPDMPLSAQSGLLPHVSQRRDVWEFPRLMNAEYVVVDRRAWRSSQSNRAGYIATLRELPTRGFCLLVERDGVQLWARGDRCASPS